MGSVTVSAARIRQTGRDGIWIATFSLLYGREKACGTAGPDTNPKSGNPRPGTDSQQAVTTFLKMGNLRRVGRSSKVSYSTFWEDFADSLGGVG